LDLVLGSVGLLVRLATILDDMTTTAAEEVRALKANLAWLVVTVVVGKAQIHTRHLGW
jgi:hypothetical protein